jgi:hypothetical protein
MNVIVSTNLKMVVTLKRAFHTLRLLFFAIFTTANDEEIKIKLFLKDSEENVII